jgi:group I intron endonuclease
LIELARKQSGIYQIHNVVNGKSYVGSAVCLRSRISKHRNDLRTGIHHSQKLQRAWAKYGEDSFAFNVIEFVEEDRLIAREQHWIDFLNSVDAGYNVCRIAGSILGVKRSRATKAKMSRSLRGRVLPPLTEEHKKRISACQKGRVKSAEERTKLSRALTGKRLSEETKRKLSIANLGSTHTTEAREKISAAHKGRIKSAQERANISAAKRGVSVGRGRKQTAEHIHNRILSRRLNQVKECAMGLERMLSAA